MNVVKGVMIAFLIVSVLAVATILSLTNIRDVAETIDIETVNIVNLTVDSEVNESSGADISGTAGLRNCVATITSALNQTDGAQGIAAGNYTTSACQVQCVVGSCEGFNNTLWNVTGSYVYSPSRSYDISSNVTAGEQDFFTNTSTIFAILIVVVIILAIAIIIGVVTRFGGGSIGGGVGGRAPDTVMGI